MSAVSAATEVKFPGRVLNVYGGSELLVALSSTGHRHDHAVMTSTACLFMVTLNVITCGMRRCRWNWHLERGCHARHVRSQIPTSAALCKLAHVQLRSMQVAVA